MKLTHLLEATSRKVVIIFIDGEQMDLFLYPSAQQAWDELVKDGPSEDAHTIIISEYSGTFQGLELGNGHPEEVAVNGDDDGVVFARRGGKILTDKYNLQSPLGKMIDPDDNPQMAALAKKLADRKAKK